MSIRPISSDRQPADTPAAGSHGSDDPAPDRSRTPATTQRRGRRGGLVAPAFRILAAVSAGLVTAVGLSAAYAHVHAAEPSGLAPDQQELVRLINLARARGSCPALRTDRRLNAAAQAQADDMVRRGFTSDVNPDNEDALVRAQREGYPGNVAEDLAVGLAEPEEVVTQWTNPADFFAREPGRRLLNCRLVSVGVGHDTGMVRPPLAAHVWVVTLGDR